MNWQYNFDSLTKCETIQCNLKSSMLLHMKYCVCVCACVCVCLIKDLAHSQVLAILKKFYRIKLWVGSFTILHGSIDKLHVDFFQWLKMYIMY